MHPVGLREFTGSAECLICTRREPPLVITGCRSETPHVFHRVCLENWWSYGHRRTCPCDRNLIFADEEPVSIAPTQRNRFFEICKLVAYVGTCITIALAAHYVFPPVNTSILHLCVVFAAHIWISYLRNRELFSTLESSITAIMSAALGTIAYCIIDSKYQLKLNTSIVYFAFGFVVAIGLMALAGLRQRVNGYHIFRLITICGIIYLILRRVNLFASIGSLVVAYIISPIIMTSLDFIVSQLFNRRNVLDSSLAGAGRRNNRQSEFYAS